MTSSGYSGDKDWVGMGYALCPVCMCKTDESVVLDKRMRKSLKRDNFTGWSMCKEHQKLKDDGFIAIVESTGGSTLEDAKRAGRVAHIRGSVWGNIFNTPVPEKGLCFAPPEVFTMLENIPVAP